MRKINKKTSPLQIICALFLCGSSAYAAAAASSASVTPSSYAGLGTDMFDDRQFKPWIEPIKAQQLYFLVPKDDKDYKEYIGRLDTIVTKIATNHPFTLQQGWEIFDEYVRILLQDMPSKESKWADDNQQKEIIDRLWNVKGVANFSNQFDLPSNIFERYINHIPEIKSKNLQNISSSRFLDLFSKLSILAMNELNLGNIDSGNEFSKDFTGKQEFPSLFRDLIKYPTCFLFPALNALHMAVKTREWKSLSDDLGDKVESGVRDLLVHYVSDYDPAKNDGGLGIIPCIQIRAIAKLFFPDSTQIINSENNLLNALNKNIREKEERIKSELSQFGNVFFCEHAPHKYSNPNHDSVSARILQYVKDKPVGCPEFNVCLKFWRTMSLDSYVPVTILGRIGMSREGLRRAYLNQLIAQGSVSLSGSNLYMANSFNPNKNVFSALSSSFSSAAAASPAPSAESPVLFDVAIIDYTKMEEGTFWNENAYAHGEIVNAVFEDYSARRIKPKLIPIDSDVLQTNIEKLKSALNRTATAGNNTLISLSIGLGIDRSVWEAVKANLQKGNVIFLAIDNEGKSLGSSRDDLALFLDWLRDNIGDPALLDNLHLVSNVSESATMEWKKIEKAADKSEKKEEGEKSKEETYVAILTKSLISQGFGESLVFGDMASFASSHGVAASGDYYSKKYNKRVLGTSFATPAVAGTIAQSIYHFMTMRMPWPQATKQANHLFKQSLRKNKICLVWDETKQEPSLHMGDPLEPSNVGRGVFDYESFISLVLDQKPIDRWKVKPPSDLKIPAKARKDLNGIVTRSTQSYGSQETDARLLAYQKEANELVQQAVQNFKKELGQLFGG